MYFVVGNLVTEIYIFSRRSSHLCMAGRKECFPSQFALFPSFEYYSFYSAHKTIYMYINTVADFNFSTTYIYTLNIKCYVTINLVWNTFIIIIIIIIVEWANLNLQDGCTVVHHPLKWFLIKCLFFSESLNYRLGKQYFIGNQGPSLMSWRGRWTIPTASSNSESTIQILFNL